MPLFENTPPFFASLEKPLDGAVGSTRITSDVFERYHVALRSAFSPQKPMSKPPSSSFVRSGCSVRRRLGEVREQSAEPALRRREACALRDAADQVRSAERRRREIRLRLLPRFAVRQAHFAERQEARLVHVRERPRGARLREQAPAVVASERRRPVVAQRAGQEQLVVQIERRLPEVRLVVNLRLIVARRIARERVENAERLRAR